MRVWLINPYGPIPGEGWRDYRFTLLGSALAARGHHVVWWTASFAHQTKTFRSPGWSTRNVNESFSIELVPTPAYHTNVSIRRIMFEASFARTLFRRARHGEPPDLIVAADPPQLAGWAGRGLARRFGVPLVLDCLDLWPEQFVNTARGVTRPLVRLGVSPLHFLRRKNVSAASLLVAVADAYRETVLSSIVTAPPSITIPVGVNLGAFRRDERPDRSTIFTAIYAGTLGVAYDLETVLEAAACLQDDGTRVRFVIAGRGPLDARLREFADERHLENVIFAGSLAERDLMNWYASASCGLVSYVRGSAVVWPLKVFDYLASGLPVVISLGGEAAERIINEGAGIRYVPGDPDSLVAAIRRLHADEDLCRQMSARAAAISREFDWEPLYALYCDAVEALLGK